MPLFDLEGIWHEERQRGPHADKPEPQVKRVQREIPGMPNRIPVTFRAITGFPTRVWNGEKNVANWAKVPDSVTDELNAMVSGTHGVVFRRWQDLGYALNVSSKSLKVFAKVVEKNGGKATKCIGKLSWKQWELLRDATGVK